MNSLRKRLTLWLWVAVATVGAVCVVLGNWQAHRVTQSQLDYQMEQVAHILAGQGFSDAMGSDDSSGQNMLPHVPIRHDSDDDLLVAVRDAQGKILYLSRTNRYLPRGPLPLIEALGFHTVNLGSCLLYTSPSPRD